jgi:hypothetical protein
MFNSYCEAPASVNDSVNRLLHADRCGGLARMGGRMEPNRWTQAQGPRHLAMRRALTTASCDLRKFPVFVEKQGKIR